MTDDDTFIGFGADPDLAEIEDRAERDALYASGRRTDRTYVSRSFDSIGHPGTPARFVYKVFDSESGTDLEREAEGTEWIVRQSPQGRVQIRLLVAGEAGHVSDLWVEKITNPGTTFRAERILNLRGEDARRLVELVRSLEFIPVEGDEGIRIDDALLRELFSAPDQLAQLYMQEPNLFRSLIAEDVASRDVVALASRRAAVERFRRLLEDDEYFEACVAENPREGDEVVWQEFFEENPWILGASLGGQLFTSWDAGKLEQVVGGSSIARQGKRADALLRTSGVVRWLTFAEVKTHRTKLLHGFEYRPGTWAPSRELIGGVAQSQATVRRAVNEFGEALRATAADGSEIPGDVTFLTRPRSFLVIGHLDELLGERGGPHSPRVHSFELFRRSLIEPEVVTFDELLARAEWIVDTGADA